MPKDKILVVDDEAIVRESIRDWLKLSNYDVSTAESGEEALAMIENQDFNIMVLDIRLPGESGIGVLAKAKSISPKLKSIITAYPTEDTVTEAKSLGLSIILLNSNNEDLERLIRETIDSRVEGSPKEKSNYQKPAPSFETIFHNQWRSEIIGEGVTYRERSDRRKARGKFI
jgi:DNA-binding NtrC family response regulator